MQRFTNFERF